MYHGSYTKCTCTKMYTVPGFVYMYMSLYSTRVHVNANVHVLIQYHGSCTCTCPYTVPLTGLYLGGAWGSIAPPPPLLIFRPPLNIDK